MDPFEEKVIRQLYLEPASLSRNRNFATFEDPLMKRARRRAGHLRSLRDRLNEVPDCTVVAELDETDGRPRWCITVAHEERRWRQQTWLELGEVAILLEDNSLSAVEALRAAAREDRFLRSSEGDP